MLAAAFLELAAEQLIRSPQSLALLGFAQDEECFARVKGLCEVVVGSPLHGLDGQVGRAVGGHHDDRGFGETLHQLGEELEAVDSRHPEIAQRRVSSSSTIKIRTAMGLLRKSLRCNADMK